MRMRTLAMGLIVFVAACGGSEAEDAPEIATLTTPGATASASPTAATGAPIIRPDTTWDEQRVMMQPFMRCVRERGLETVTDAKGLLDFAPPDGRARAFDDPEFADCQRLFPVLAPELDEDRNPYWEDDNDNYHECRVAGGEPLVKVDGQWRPGPGWDTWAPDEAMDMECQAGSFDGKKG